LYLEANFDTLDAAEKDKWIYANPDELETCLDEIATLIKDKLLAWFDNPIAPGVGKGKITQAQLREQMEKAADLDEEIARKLYSEGKIEEAKRHEYAARLYRKHLMKPD
jgi:hypothetical protein